MSNRDARTGEFVTKDYADANPDTTVTEAEYRPTYLLTDDATIEEYCEVMHNAYERAADTTGWETNPASRRPWEYVPESNKATMRVAVRALIEHING